MLGIARSGLCSSFVSVQGVDWKDMKVLPDFCPFWCFQVITKTPHLAFAKFPNSSCTQPRPGPTPGHVLQI